MMPYKPKCIIDFIVGFLCGIVVIFIFTDIITKLFDMVTFYAIIIIILLFNINENIRRKN